MCMCCLKTIIDCDIGMRKIKLETRETHNSQEKVLGTEQYQIRELRGNTKLIGEERKVATIFVSAEAFRRKKAREEEKRPCAA